MSPAVLPQSQPPERVSKKGGTPLSLTPVSEAAEIRFAPGPVVLLTEWSSHEANFNSLSTDFPSGAYCKSAAAATAARPVRIAYA